MVALHGLRLRYKPRQLGFASFGAIPTLQERALPMAYILLCLRFTLLVRLIASSRWKVFLTSDSAQRARLDTGGRLNLTRLGLSPSKMLQASLVARHGRTASYPSRPHTDPDVRNYRIRLFNNIIARVKHRHP